ncbi:MAG: hydantoinase B/oxoprolinase family protein [Deltaproteobacteria bacterium]|nr:hydantoinase B/oxoprolinase family protein [Deltaproteobacteria bacterium]MBW2421327.1 hydantoinase B/oxoprolinase family protein [Deltaproteobacteria bacterium]
MAALSLKERLAANDEAFKKTGHLFGLERLALKESNPGDYEAVWHILSNLCNAAWATGCKVSSSPIAAEGGDALWGLHTPTGEAICISRGISAHAGLLSDMVKNFISIGYEEYPGFKPGDIFENNDPHYGGIHSPDFDMCMPLFYDGKLIAWATCVSHVADAGSVTPGSIGFLNPDCYSDGIAISMERVGENDRFYPWYELRIRSRSRTPDFVMGDARGRLAGCITLRERLEAMIEKYGLDFFEQAGHEYVEDSRRYAVGRVKTQTVPGRIRKSQFKDLAMKGKRVLMAKQDIDCAFNLPMELTVNADASVSLSLQGASGTVPFGENISPTALKSGLMMGYSHIVGFDMFNSGPISAWDIEMPPDGSWANPYPLDYQAASGVAWAPAVTWVSSLYEVFGRLFQMRGFVEEMAAGSATIMTAEFSGINQTGMYLTGLTLEQASNGSPAKGYSDGENSAWCIYTPEADFGNAEITELYYPILFLGRNIEPNSGGYGQFRGGLGHTAVWMVYNTPGLEYQCGDAGMRSKIVGNHGMYGAYPVVPDRPAYAHDTNVKELIDAQKPLVHGRGDPESPEVATIIKAKDLQTDAVAPFVTPQPLTDYDIIVHPIGGAQAMGDPINRDPKSVASDLDEGWTTERVAADIHGVVTKKPNRHYEIDEAATEKKRKKIRDQRKKRALPFKEWWTAERKRILAQENMDESVRRMWISSMELSPKYAEELRAFWKLPEDFVFSL